MVLLLVAAPPFAKGEQLREVTDVLVVEIPVQVTRSGQPVRGLTADDFEVRDRGKRREIVGFDAIDLTGESAGASSSKDISLSARRHFLFLFDIALTNPGLILRARNAARRLVDEALHPTDLVAVGAYSVSGAQILLSFTPDREQARLAIDGLGSPELLPRAPDPLGIVLAERANPSAVAPGSGGFFGAGIDAESEVRRRLEQIEERSDNVTHRNSVLGLASAMTELAEMIGAVRGRKHVIFLSQGFESSVAFGAGVGGSSGREEHRQAAEAAMSGRYWEVNSDRRFGETHVLTNLELMTQAFVRAGSTVQTVNVAGLSSGASADDGLFMMADRTGGEYYRNYNDLGKAMGKMLSRTSVTYVLAIQPKNLRRDGSFRRLSVRLRKGLPDARVVYRPGYFSPSRLDERSPLERRLVTAEMLLGDREGGAIATETRTKLLAVGENGTGVELTIEIDSESLFAGRRSGTLEAEVYAYAIDSVGSVQDYFARKLRFRSDDLDLGEAGGALPVSGRLDLPPGEYSLRTLVLDPSTSASGLRTTRVVVPEGG